MFRTVPSRIVAFVIVAVALLRVHVAAQGIPTFERYIVTNAIYHEATDMVELPDSDLVFSGYVHFAGGISDGLLMRTDKNAQLEWMRTYSSPDGPVELKRTVFTNGSLYVLGDQAGVILSKLDTSGAPQWAKRLSFGPRTLSRQLQQTLDGNLLVAATDSIGTILTRLDVNGVLMATPPRAVPARETGLH